MTRATRLGNSLINLLTVFTLLPAAVIHGLVSVNASSVKSTQVKAESKSPHNSSSLGPSASHLVDNIRRKLMADNYDYMSSETEESFPTVHELDNAETTTQPPAAPRADAPAPDLHYRAAESTELQPHLNDIFIPRARDETNDEHLSEFDTASDDHGIVKNDLLYYVDDVRLKKEETDSYETEAWDAADANVSLERTATNIKYKIIKVKQPVGLEPRRRSGAAGGAGGFGGGDTYRRFLQEEGGSGVAIINLDNDPFPQFRLPNARDQNMDGAPDLEVAPISDLSELSDRIADEFKDSSA